MSKDLDKRIEKRNKEIRINRLNGLMQGDAIKYGKNDYLIVKEIKDGKIYGQLATPVGVNAVPIEDLAKKEIYIAYWDKY